MGYGKYYEARETIEHIIASDLLGPVSANEIICDDRPLEYYILGKLYPQGSGYNDLLRSTAEDCGELDDEAGVSLSNSGNPSSFGISFAVSALTQELSISAKAAQYVLIPENDARKELGFEEGKYKKNANFWRRIELDIAPVHVNIRTCLSVT